MTDLGCVRLFGHRSKSVGSDSLRPIGCMRNEVCDMKAPPHLTKCFKR